MSNIEKLFFEIDSKVESIKDKYNSYFEALANYLTFEKDEDYFRVIDNYSKEDIRKVYQFLLLKSLKELNNTNYDITPEIIAFYVANILEVIYEGKDISVCDLASGSGNFILAISQFLSGEVNLTSVDVDTTYVKLQQDIYNILETNVEIIHQDALQPINIELQDIVVSDVPLGYYADEDNSLNYRLCSEEGYSNNALLFIEQSVNYIKNNGVAILVIPEKILEFDNKFKKYIKEIININAVISLPENMFKNKDQKKCILIITKKDQNRLPKQVFLGEISSYQSKSNYNKFINEFKNWILSK